MRLFQLVLPLVALILVAAPALDPNFHSYLRVAKAASVDANSAAHAEANQQFWNGMTLLRRQP